MAATPSTPLDAALDYARRSWYVLPVHNAPGGVCSCGGVPGCKPGKHPRIGNWTRAATTDPKSIREWFTRWPDANVGVLCGARSGIVVMDCDGEEGRVALERLSGAAQPTVVQATGRSGGAHYFFQHPGGRIASTIGLEPHLDVRGDGSFVVVTPSGHTSGRSYRWEPGCEPGAVSLAPVPPLLLARLVAPKAGKETKAVRAPGVPVREGERDSTLFALAVALNHAGLSETAIRAALKVENEGYIPPLPDSEVSRTITSALSGNYEPSARRPPERQIGPDDRPLWERRVHGSELPAFDKLTLLTVASFDWDGLGAGCLLSQRALASRVPCALGTLRQSLKRLTAGRLLCVQRRWDPDGKGRMPDALRVKRTACAALPQRCPYSIHTKSGALVNSPRSQRPRPNLRRKSHQSEAATLNIESGSGVSSTGGCVPKGLKERGRRE